MDDDARADWMRDVGARRRAARRGRTRAPAALVRATRLDRNRDQAALVRAAGTTRATIGHLEAGGGVG